MSAGAVGDRAATIHPIDLGYLDRPGAALAFLVLAPRSGGGAPHAVLVETGPIACLDRLEAGLRRCGVDPAAIEAVLPTHVHLDHAGAAGAFAARGAVVHVHPRGVRHLVDPTRLVESSRMVHGALFERFYGAPRPCAESRVRAVVDGGRVEIGPLSFTAVETLGHAKHHHAWRLDHAGGSELFTGDVAAMRVPGSAFISIPTPPTDFDPPAWRASLRRLRSLGADRLHLTHGGRIDSPNAWLDAVERRFEEESAELLAIAASPLDQAAAIERYRRWLHARAAAAGVDREANAAFLGRAFLEMNIAGARGWLDRGGGSAG